ncbi:Pentatricopeptide repeat-containing protein [Camellia lanceoleosa]|uniref:Pentatricopeptide repeat-containing protein n=1 Tax=Camellia lanceoleosa TaxID=1840588 RepID=A0ACC0G3E8_9ERIC|nr:Pentatricopeptide repeat-containing protein [Camellia lanceoleosa]
MDLPHEVENVMEEKRDLIVKSSVFEFRSVIYASGKLGLFADKKRCVVQKEIEGFILHTFCSIMVLSSFGAHGELSEMVLWFQMMKSPGVSFSIRTYNSVLNSCPTIMTMLQELKTVTISIQEPIENLRGDEGLLVQELIGSSVLEKAMEWSSLEGKLDLHGIHLGLTCLIMLQLAEKLWLRFRD